MAERDQQEREAREREAAATLNQTVPGGRYLGVDGKPHDAHGEPLSGSAAKSAAKQGAGGDDEGAGADYESMSVEELQDEAGDLEVPGSGAGGRVLKADLVRALEKRDRAK